MDAALRQPQVAALDPDQLPGDGEAEARPAGPGRAAERAEQVLDGFGRKAGAVIDDLDLDFAVPALARMVTRLAPICSAFFPRLRITRTAAGRDRR